MFPASFLGTSRVKTQEKRRCAKTIEQMFASQVQSSVCSRGDKNFTSPLGGEAHIKTNRLPLCAGGDNNFREVIKVRAGAPQNPGSNNYEKKKLITSSSSQPSLQPASSRPSSWQPCHLPPSISDTDLGDEISETMAVVLKWVTHSHRSVASVAATTSGFAIQVVFNT